MQARPISFRTERYEVRTLRAEDASERYLSWYLDPKVMHPQNAPTARLTMDELRAHIAGFDRQKSHLLGIFDPAKKLHVGCYILNIQPQHRIARIHIMIGDEAYRNRGVATETTTGLIDHLFASRGIEKVVVQVLTSKIGFNRVMEKIGMRVEGHLKGEVIASGGSGRLDQVLYGILKKEWPALAEGTRR